MNYIENIYICLAAPLLIVVLCLRGQGKRSILFVLGGMTACLLSSSTFQKHNPAQYRDASVAGLGALQNHSPVQSPSPD